MTHPSAQLEQRWLRTPQAAEAIGVPVKTLNSWINRGALDCLGLRGTNCWKLFSLRDLAGLSLAPDLSASGASLAEAVRWSVGFFDPQDVDFSQRGALSEAAHFARTQENRAIAVWTDENGLHLSEIHGGYPPARRFTILRAGLILSECFGRALAMSPAPRNPRARRQAA